MGLSERIKKRTISYDQRQIEKNYETVHSLQNALEAALEWFYSGFGEDGPEDDEIPGWVIHAEQTLSEVS